MIERPGGAPNPETGRKFATAKARVVTTFFHTVRFPNLHEATFLVDRDVRIGRDTMMHQGEVRQTAEAVLLDPRATTPQKAGAIMKQFEPVAPVIVSAETDPNARYGALIALSEQGVADRVYQDTQGHRLAVTDILPPPLVVDGMFDTYTNPNRTSCPELETFIEMQSAPDNRI